MTMMFIMSDDFVSYLKYLDTIVLQVEQSSFGLARLGLNTTDVSSTACPHVVDSPEGAQACDTVKYR